MAGAGEGGREGEGICSAHRHGSDCWRLIFNEQDVAKRCESKRVCLMLLSPGAWHPRPRGFTHGHEQGHAGELPLCQPSSSSSGEQGAGSLPTFSGGG